MAGEDGGKKKDKLDKKMKTVRVPDEGKKSFGKGEFANREGEKWD